MVVRCPNGGGVGGGPYHSENVEAWFHHHAGLKIVCPATAADAYGLLRAAIQRSQPGRLLRAQVPVPAREGRGGDRRRRGRGARSARRGSRAPATTSASSPTPPRCSSRCRSPTRLAAEGTSAEVIDLRTLIPLDIETVLASVRKTGKALIVHEDNLTGGFGAEVAALVAQRAFEYLDAPVTRVAGARHADPLHAGARARVSAHGGGHPARGARARRVLSGRPRQDRRPSRRKTPGRDRDRVIFWPNGSCAGGVRDRNAISPQAFHRAGRAGDRAAGGHRRARRRAPAARPGDPRRQPAVGGGRIRPRRGTAASSVKAQAFAAVAARSRQTSSWR